MSERPCGSGFSRDCRCCSPNATPCSPPLLPEFLNAIGLSQSRLAKDISVPPRRINEMVHGKRAITAHTAFCLSRFFGTSEQFWLNLQTAYDLEVARERLGGWLETEVAVRASHP